MMKVAVVNTYDYKGGAAKAAHNIYNVLKNDEELEIQYFVREKIKYDDRIHKIEHNSITNKLITKLDNSFSKIYLNKKGGGFSNNRIASSKIINEINNFKPDIVHLHWINHGFLKLSDLRKIKAPIVWTFHDMWSFTGGCHFSENCSKYTDTCGKCPILNSSYESDLSKYNIAYKIKSYKNIDFKIIATNKWSKEQIHKSYLFNDYEDEAVEVIPIGVEPEIFYIIDNIEQLKLKYRVPYNKTILMFNAYSMDDRRKGIELLLETLKILKNDKYHLIITGKKSDKYVKLLDEISVDYQFLGFIHKEEIMNELYNIADMLIIPSRQETLPNVILESLATGTPVLSFNICGHPDAIKHRHNGYLSNPFDVKSLAEGIEWIDGEKVKRNYAERIRFDCLNKFDISIVKKRHLELYKKILK